MTNSVSRMADIEYDMLLSEVLSYAFEDQLEEFEQFAKDVEISVNRTVNIEKTQTGEIKIYRYFSCSGYVAEESIAQEFEALVNAYNLNAESEREDFLRAVSWAIVNALEDESEEVCSALYAATDLQFIGDGNVLDLLVDTGDINEALETIFDEIPNLELWMVLHEIVLNQHVGLRKALLRLPQYREMLEEGISRGSRISPEQMKDFQAALDYFIEHQNMGINTVYDLSNTRGVTRFNCELTLKEFDFLAEQGWPQCFSLNGTLDGTQVELSIKFFIEQVEGEDLAAACSICEEGIRTLLPEGWPPPQQVKLERHLEYPPIDLVVLFANFPLPRGEILQQWVNGIAEGAVRADLRQQVLDALAHTAGLKNPN
jgi:hypothetical protein